MMIFNMMTAKIAKPLALASVAYFLQSSEGGSFIDKAFEYGPSIGILAIVVVMLYKEYKTSMTYNKERDAKLEKLIADSTEAYRDMKVAIDNLADEQKQFRDELKFIHRRVDTNRRLIEDKNTNTNTN